MTEQHSASIVFVDDEPRAGDLFARFARSEGLTVHSFRNPLQALEHIDAQGADLVISDLKMPDMTGLELLRNVKARQPELPFVMITGYSTLDDAIEALRLGAADFIKKPYEPEDLIRLAGEILDRADDATASDAPPPDGPGQAILGESPAIGMVYRIIDKIADVRINVMIEGESGSGKELAAKAVHERSQFADTPFIVIDCGALTDTLLESELFGHEKGAFTGAATTKPGLLEVASGGTVFLDEIGNISDNMQVKLLRVIQEQQVTRVGGVKPIDIDVRFIVASNRALAKMVEAGEFRHDLYHRLNVVRIRMPPLRERREDIPALARHFLNSFARRYHRDVHDFDEEAMRRLVHYAWPGNVRELKNLVERLVALADGPLLNLEASPDGMQDAMPGAAMTAAPDSDLPLDHDLPTLEVLERRYIEKVLALQEGNRERTARTLGINKSTLWRKLQSWEQER
ncbi:MAG: sigma-54-dependent transcriptional regulator [Halothiobacillaceae bacterium]